MFIKDIKRNLGVFFDLSMSLNCSIFMSLCGKKGGDSNGSLMVAVPKTAITTKYGGNTSG